MPTPIVILSNPFAQQNPLNKPLVAPRPPKQTPLNYGKPANFGNVTVSTKNPILVEPTGLALPKEVEPKTPIQTQGFWSSKTKKQKTMIIVSVVAVVSLMAYIALKKK